MCRLNFPDNVREEERRYLPLQYDAAVCFEQRSMLQCGYASAATLQLKEAFRDCALSFRRLCSGWLTGL